MEATVLPDDYLTAADEMLSQAHTSPSDSDPAAASRLEAQVKAIQAVAAAIDRLAAATSFEMVYEMATSRPVSI
jgi:hypothetical protein